MQQAVTNNLGNLFDDPKQLTGKPQVHLAIRRLDYCTQEVILQYTTYISSISNLYHIETAN